jgi:hypothetical protein
MIRHIVLLELRAGTPAETAQAIVDALRELPRSIPSIREYQAGVDLGIASGNSTVGVTSVFDDEAGYVEYRDHPAHRAVIEQLIDPVRVGRAAIQFRI